MFPRRQRRRMDISFRLSRSEARRKRSPWYTSARPTAFDHETGNDYDLIAEPGGRASHGNHCHNVVPGVYMCVCVYVATP